MQKTTLIISSDGKTAHISFKNGKESEIFESKIEIIRALPNLIEKKKITPKESKEIAIMVLRAKKLPDNNVEEDLVDILSNLFRGLLGTISMSIVSIGISNVHRKAIIKTFPEIMDDDLLTKPLFRMCACGEGNHAYILLSKDRNTFESSSRIDSKYQALQLIKIAEEKNGLVKKEASRLIKEITEYTLPKFVANEEAKAN